LALSEDDDDDDEGAVEEVDELPETEVDGEGEEVGADDEDEEDELGKGKSISGSFFMCKNPIHGCFCVFIICCYSILKNKNGNGIKQKDTRKLKSQLTASSKSKN